MRASSAIDERRRPRQSNFGSLSAGMIVRGTVPAELLTPVEPPEAEPAEATAPPPGIIALANRRHAERVARAPYRRLDKALLEAERKRPRESNFASLTASMVERGKVSRDILSAAQVELLLQPQPVDMQQLQRLVEAAPREDDPAPAVDDPAPDPDIAEEEVEADPTALAPSLPLYAAEPSDVILVPAPTPSTAAPEPVTILDAPTPRRPAGMWAAALLAMTVIGGTPSSTLLMPPVAPPTAVVAPPAETEQPDLMSLVSVETMAAPPEAAEPTAGMALPAVEAIDEDEQAAPAAPIEFRRQRPGAVQEEPEPPVAMPPPPCETARSCAGIDR